MEVDEGMFTAFATKSLKTLLAEVEMVVSSSWKPAYKGVDGGAVIRFAVALLATFGVVVPALIMPQSDILHKAGDALCGKRIPGELA